MQSKKIIEEQPERVLLATAKQLTTA